MSSVELLLFEKQALQQICRYVDQQGFDVELGGIFLGLRRGKCIHVSRCTFPGRDDQSRRFRFFRKDSSHQEIAHKLWTKSGHKMDWVGEWHSHPEAAPCPSTIDKATWRSQAESRHTAMAYLIVGTSGTWTGLQFPKKAVQNLTQLGESSSRILFGVR